MAKQLSERWLQPDPRPTVGGVVRTARRKMGLSTAQLAERAGLNTNTVERIEHEKTSRTVSLMRIVAVFGLKMSEFWTIVERRQSRAEELSRALDAALTSAEQSNVTHNAM